LEDRDVTDRPDETPRAWIEVIEESDAHGELAELYDELRSKSMRDHERLYRTLMYGPGGLSRPERETIGVVVSALNRCHY
jgi:hypothetical protein